MLRTVTFGLMIPILAASALAVSFPPPPAEADKKPEHKTEAKASMLDSIKKLEGTWETTTDEGKKVVGSVFKVTSGGTAVVETLFPGTDHEMTNMYHADGDSLVMTHYCAMGNQPRMKCTGSKDGKTFEFAKWDCTNLKDKNAMNMGAMTLVITDNDHIETHWTSYVNGKEGDHKAEFKHTRKKG